jgi:hypothetical protein
MEALIFDRQEQIKIRIAKQFLLQTFPLPPKSNKFNLLRSIVYEIKHADGHETFYFNS